MKQLLIVFFIFFVVQTLGAQRDVQLVTSQLGFMPTSPKTVTFFARNAPDLKLPEKIPFYITNVGYRRSRTASAIQPSVWQTTPFRFPIDISKGKYANPDEKSLYTGFLEKIETAWGTFWQADFSDFKTEGVFQIENEYAFTVPFTIEKQLYERLERSFLVYLNCQRSGVEIPGVRAMMHQDDGRLDSDSTFWAAAGGWYDAGDWRKWLTLTQGNMEALALIIKNGHPAFKQKALDELRWGNQYYQRMINDEGMVYEDLAGGDLRFGYNYENGWWVENHPGCVAGGGINITDGIPGTDDERMIRVHYTSLAQFQFVRYQMISYSVVEPYEKGFCLFLAEKAWKYGQKNNSDRRTLFVAEELLAAVELYKNNSKLITKDKIKNLVNELLSRQEINKSGLSGYFMEENNKDGYRSVAFSSEPVLALLAFSEANINGLEILKDIANKAITEYAEKYLIADSKSNPFSFTPYGIYVNPPFPKDQKFRETGVKDRYVRSFIHLFAERQMPHGTGGVVMSQAYFLAKAAKLMNKPEYKSLAEKLVQWTTGNNPAGLCLATGVGFRHPVTANFVAYKIPEAMVVGFLGYPNDSPYIETSNAIEWSTQEIWDVPFAYTIGAIEYLK